ncbi:dTDP-4-dehydrorhamnose reductase [Merismopedia glauca]|uniref:dTDP-4-dehydrorhamnose reductase n=1 Tax=Merismopedia glauca CCAP 1448/3 TaxID=1296344 RepID=A0A2T1C4C4_9CYAN|nr:dTDP-4-dehydrorhamnose reductase [Merismopedia glauca]PSB03074.1 dTDP-4-dehydrorhamnose reductase [Merismopedia glauca CCAP 1448/3]
MNRILLIGSDGQLGQELQETLKRVELFPVNRQQLDLSEPKKIRELVEEVQPQIIINAAAYTAVDKAETEPDLATSVNGTAPTIMAQVAQEQNAFLIHVSTDYVFDGTKSTPYVELDSTNPLNVYGHSKLMGEQGIQAHTDRYILLRTAWVYGEFGKANFVKTMLRLFGDKEEVKVVADQAGTPTWTGDIAEVIAKLSDRIAENLGDAARLQSLAGIYHYTNSGIASWYDLAVAIYEEAEALGLPMKLQRLVPISTPEYPTLAQRPAYSVLSSQKVSSLLSGYPPQWRQSLRKMLVGYISN